MEARKLFYEDCELRTFSAIVTGCTQTPEGWAVTLDQTAFYPEGGGQACDLGTLNGVRVLDVREKEGDICHLCEGFLAPSTRVEGAIDWARRFDLMQQHSGEHIVSGLVHSRFGYHNVGFHVGKELMEIDFDGPISPEALLEIEQEANRAVFENLPIRCWYPSEAALPQEFYRTKKALAYPVRLVQIPGVDSCACCGVHVKTTGQIGLIKIVSWTKFHQGVRIGLCCGGRAVELVQAVFEQNRQVSQAFSAKLLETGAAAVKMNEALATEKLRANTLQTRVFAQIAESCRDRGNVLRFEKGLEPGQIRELADRIAECCGGFAAVLSGREGAYSICIVHKDGDVKALGQTLTAQLGGRGGGKPGYFQGSVPAEEARIREALEAFL